MCSNYWDLDDRETLARCGEGSKRPRCNKTLEPEEAMRLSDGRAINLILVDDLFKALERPRSRNSLRTFSLSSTIRIKPAAPTAEILKNLPTPCWT